MDRLDKLASTVGCPACVLHLRDLPDDLRSKASALMPLAKKGAKYRLCNRSAKRTRHKCSCIDCHVRTSITGLVRQEAEIRDARTLNVGASWNCSSVLSRPDSQSFTKFVISAGALLIVAAVVVPAFVLRDTNVLEISRGELQSLTKTGRTEVERRQEIASDLGHAAPWVAGALFLTGIGLLGAGLPRLWRQEKTQDQQQALEMARLQAELEPQTPTEREERLRAEVVEDLEPEDDQPVLGHVLVEGSVESEVSTREHLEGQVISRLSAIAPPLYEIQSQVKAPDSNLFLDALLVGQVDQVPDIVVEIKIVGRHALRNANNRMREAESQLLRYMSRFRRHSIGWLILILAEEIPLAERERIEEAAADVRDVYEISIVRPEDIDDLRLPIATA